MAVDPNTDYFSPSKGSLTGFEKLTDSSGSVDLFQTGWSIDQLMAYLLNQSSANIPSVEWMKELAADIQAHINNHNNPHEDTIAMLAPDFIKQVLGDLIPGSFPQAPPLFSYVAAMEFDFDFSPATFNAGSGMSLISTAGQLYTPSDLTTRCVDYSQGRATIPCNPAIPDWLSDDGKTESNNAINTTFGTPVSAIPNPLIDTSFPYIAVTETDATGSEFGYRANVTMSPSYAYTWHGLIRPAASASFIQMRQTGQTSNYVNVDLTSGEVTTTGSGIVGYAVKLPSGWWHIGAQLLFEDGTDSSIDIVSGTNVTGSTVRDGVAGNVAFYLAAPSAVQAPGLVPHSNKTIAGGYWFSVNTDLLPASVTDMMVVMDVNLYNSIDSLLSHLSEYQYLFRFGGLSILRTLTTVEVHFNGTTVASFPITDGVNRFAVSYSAEAIVLKVRGSDRVTVEGTYPAIQASGGMPVGNFDGALASMSIYGQSDDGTNLEFLTDA